MGRDKALVEVGGRPMAAIAAAALAGAGAAEVVAVGGDVAALRAAGLVTVPDERPGLGPLGGIVTALRRAGPGVDAVVVVACDLPRLGPSTVQSLVAALAASPSADAAVAVAAVGGRRQWLVAVWRPACEAVLAAAVAAGERAVWRAAARLAVVEVPVDDPAEVDDADRPEDLPTVPGPDRDDADRPGDVAPGPEPEVEDADHANDLPIYPDAERADADRPGDVAPGPEPEVEDADRTGAVPAGPGRSLRRHGGRRSGPDGDAG